MYLCRWDLYSNYAERWLVPVLERQRASSGAIKSLTGGYYTQTLGHDVYKPQVSFVGVEQKKCAWAGVWNRDWLADRYTSIRAASYYYYYYVGKEIILALIKKEKKPEISELS